MGVCKHNFPLISNGPSTVLVEVTNLCNANCVFCPRDKMHRKQGIMNFATFRKIIDDIESINIKNLSFTNFGEPLMDKNLCEKIKYARKKLNGVRLKLVTNGSLIDEYKAKKLIESGVDLIDISFEGFSKEIYESARKGLDFDVVSSNILRLCEYAKGSRTRVNLVVVMKDEYKKYEKQFVGYWKDKVAKIYLNKIHNWGGGLGIKINKKPVVCHTLWTQFVIIWNGDVSICCMDFDSKNIVGNINEQSMSELWNGTKYKALRKQMLNCKISEIEVCKDCVTPYRAPITNLLLWNVNRRLLL